MKFFSKFKKWSFTNAGKYFIYKIKFCLAKPPKVPKGQTGTQYSMGDYTVNLINVIGQGSFGVVYSGREKGSGKRVAVKQIKIRGDDQGILNNFSWFLTRFFS